MSYVQPYCLYRGMAVSSLLEIFIISFSGSTSQLGTWEDGWSSARSEGF